MLIFKLMWRPSWFLQNAQNNSVQGLSGIKAILKCEVNPTSGFQDIAFTSNYERTAGQTGPFHINGRIKIYKREYTLKRYLIHYKYHLHNSELQVDDMS